jgi:hypothetical protein
MTMKTVLLLAAVLFALVVAILAILRLAPWKPPAIHSQGPTVERLEELRHLATARVYVSDVLTAEGDGHRGAWLIKGDALIGTDLGQAQIIEKDEAAKRATVCLPPPTILQARVDHERTRTWEVRKTTWVPWRGDQDKLRDDVMREAQRLVAYAAASAENLGHAKMGTEAILKAFYQEVGWNAHITGAAAPAGREQKSPESPSH